MHSLSSRAELKQQAGHPGRRTPQEGCLSHDANESKELTRSAESALPPPGPRQGLHRAKPSGKTSTSLGPTTSWTQAEPSREGTRPSRSPTPMPHTLTHHLRVLLAFHSAVPMTLVHLALNLYSEKKTRELVRRGPARGSAAHSPGESGRGGPAGRTLAPATAATSAIARRAAPHHGGSTQRPTWHSSRVSGTEEQQQGGEVTSSRPHGCTGLTPTSTFRLRSRTSCQVASPAHSELLCLATRNKPQF